MDLNVSFSQLCERIKGGKLIKDLKWDNLGWFSNTVLSIFLVNVRRRIPMDSRSTELLPTMPGVEQGKVFQKLLIALLLTSNHSVWKSLKKSPFFKNSQALNYSNFCAFCFDLPKLIHSTADFYQNSPHYVKQDKIVFSWFL